MNFKLDNGKFPGMNYNKVVARSRKRINQIRPETPMTLREAQEMWKIAQDVNSVNEPQLAIKGNPQGRTRRGLI